MDLWSEPMTARVAAFLLASLLTLLLLIFWEVRSHRPAPESRLAKPKVVRPRPPAAGPGQMPRSVGIIGLMAVVFAAIGFRFGVPVAAAVLALTIAILLRSLWYTGPAILAQCGARPVRDPDLIEAVAELAAKAGIGAPRLLEIEETHPNAFTLGTDGADAAIVVTLGLRRRLSAAEERAVIAREMSHIVRRDTVRATLGVTLMGAVAPLALWLGVIGRTAQPRGARALLFLVVVAPVSALALRLGGTRTRAYRADREGARLCGNPADLITALDKLDAAARRFASITADDQPAAAALFIVNPLPNSWVGQLFAAPPPVARRIARLRGLSGKHLGHASAEAESGRPSDLAAIQNAVAATEG
jgi:heat shock protein HtpX